MIRENFKMNKKLCKNYTRKADGRRNKERKKMLK